MSLLTFYLVVTFLPLVLNLATGQKADAIGLSAMLILGWAFGRIMRLWYAPPEALQFYTVQDVLFGVIALTAWRYDKAWWKAVLTGTFVFQLCAHAAYWASWVNDPTDKHALRVYMVTLNCTYLLQLALVSTGGVQRVAVGVGHGIARGLRALRPVGS